MSKTPPSPSKPASENKPDESVAGSYEGGHAAPFSPKSPEVASPDSPAVEEVRGRDTQDGKTDARRSKREQEGARSGPPEPENSPAGEDRRAPRHEAVPQGTQHPRRSHRTVH